MSFYCRNSSLKNGGNRNVWPPRTRTRRRCRDILSMSVFCVNSSSKTSKSGWR